MDEKHLDLYLTALYSYCESRARASAMMAGRHVATQSPEVKKIN